MAFRQTATKFKNRQPCQAPGQTEAGFSNMRHHMIFLHRIEVYVEVLVFFFVNLSRSSQDKLVSALGVTCGKYG
jgi:hypothetical protein